MFSEKLQQFSEKHGAVLLGMHRELQTMQQTTDETKKHVEIAVHRSDVAIQIAKDSANALDAKWAELEARMKSVSSDLDRQLSSVNGELQHQQQLAKSLFEKGLALLEEHKLREIGLKQRELVLERWVKRVEFGILITSIVVAVLLGYFAWWH